MLPYSKTLYYDVTPFMYYVMACPSQLFLSHELTQCFVSSVSETPQAAI